MPDTIYYVYERATGTFAGSGTAKIDDETFGSTTVVPIEVKSDDPIVRYDQQARIWVVTV